MMNHIQHYSLAFYQVLMNGGFITQTIGREADETDFKRFTHTHC